MYIDICRYSALAGIPRTAGTTRVAAHPLLAAASLAEM
jgi:hypothetical protein